MNEKELLEQAIINQIEKDLEEQDYDSLSELIKNLIHLEPAEKLLIGYLSDEVKEDWLEGKVEIKY
jgi:hypothetical protein